MSRSSTRRWANIVVALVIVAAFALVPSLPSEAAVANAVDYSQCTNGAPNDPDKSDSECLDWINGILQASNSHYREDEVTPQRLIVRVGSGTDHSVVLRYQTRKGGSADGTHAYDSLTTWNVTQESADRCEGLTNSVKAAISCADDTATYSEAAIPPDNTSVGPCVEIARTDPFTGASVAQNDDDCKTRYRQIPGKMIMHGAGTLVSVVNLGHENADGGGDDYASVQVNFTTPSSGGTTQLLFGGHLAAPKQARAWGVGLGAANINGGPYHIKWDKADGASIGNRDNQIMGSAILPFYSGSFASDASPDTPIYPNTATNVSDSATYTLGEVGGNPTNANAVKFTLHGPFSNGQTGLSATSCVRTEAANPNATPPVVANEQARVSATFSGSGLVFTAATGNVSVSLAEGDYYWVVTYDGDGGQNLPAGPHGCGDATELLQVRKASPGGITVQALRDSLVVTPVTGAPAPSGTVNFKLYRDDPAVNGANACDVLVYDSSDSAKGGGTDPSLALSGSNWVATSHVVADLVAGTYNWVATWSGNTGNNGVTKACGSETAVISYTPANP